MAEITPLLAALKTVGLLLGGAVTFFAARAYRRTRARPLGVLAVGFAVVTLGALTAGVLDQFLAVTPETALAVDGALTALGFAVILYSLFVEPAR